MVSRRGILSSRKIAVIAGAAGFIGSHLTLSLIEQGFDVVCVDNLCTGRWKNLDEASILASAKGQILWTIQENVCSPTLVEKVLAFTRGEAPFAYFNLACPASPVAYQKDPMGTLDTCYVGTKTAMKFAALGSRVLHASTSEIYGDPEVHPQEESYKGHVNTWGPRANYDEGKRVAETICYEHLQRGHDVRVVRIFNTFGPRMQVDDGRVVSNFVVQALCGQDITIYGDGTQTRSFCYVDDLVRGIISYLHKDEPHSFPINLGNPQERTIGEAAEFIVRTMCSTSKVTYLPLPQDDPKRRNPTIKVAQEVLGWNPEISFEEGIRRTIDYFSIELDQNF